MPELKTRNLFISHAWQYNPAYHTIINWFNEEPNFSWKNFSVPEHNPLLAKTSQNLMIGITNQMRPAQVIIIIAGMYAAHSGWIDYEIEEALRMNKIIIGIRPWGQERMPIKVQQAAQKNGRLVNWQRSSLIQVVRELV